MGYPPRPPPDPPSMRHGRCRLPPPPPPDPGGPQPKIHEGTLGVDTSASESGRPGGGPEEIGLENPAGRLGIIPIDILTIFEVVTVMDGPVSMVVVGVLILDPTQVKVYGLFENVVSVTPQGIPVDVSVAIYRVRELVPITVPVIVPALYPVPAIHS